MEHVSRYINKQEIDSLVHWIKGMGHREGLLLINYFLIILNVQEARGRIIVPGAKSFVVPSTIMEFKSPFNA